MPRRKFYTCHIILFFAGLLVSGFHALGQDSSTLQIVPPEPVQTDSTLHFNELTTAPVIREHSLPDSTVKKLRRDDAFWYVNTTPEKVKQAQGTSAWNVAWLGKIFWFLIICAFILITVLFVINSNLRLFRRKAAVIATGIEEDAAEDIFSRNFEQEIAQAAGKGAYTTAVRLHYLATLRAMSERALIDYAEQKTNSSYIFQLAGTEYFEGFATLTHQFERAWYGKFPLSKDEYISIDSDFRHFKSSLSV